MRFVFALLLFPLLEIAGFILVGDAIGVGPTLLLIIATAIAGVLLLRSNGVDTIRRAQARMDRGEPPLREAFDGLCLALAGLLLFIPGFLTDILGVLLFLPPVRGWLFGRMNIIAVDRTGTGVSGGLYDPARRGSTTVIEGDYTEVEVRADTDQSRTEELPPPDSRWRPPPRD